MKISQDRVKGMIENVFSGKSTKQVIKFDKEKSLCIPEIKPESRTRGGLNMAQVIIEKGGVFYTDLEQNMVYNDKVVLGKEVVIAYEISDLEWNITAWICFYLSGNFQIILINCRAKYF